MLIKKVDGSVADIEEVRTAYQNEIWVKWLDIKPILEEYQQEIGNEGVGVSDWSILDKGE